MNPHFPMGGRCTCRAVGFRMETAPLFVHCCHCTWCQRETGTAFALNAMIETDRLTLLHGEPETVVTPSNSGKGQKIVRCPSCRVALWSHYPGAGEAVSFVRVGTLEQPGAGAAGHPHFHVHETAVGDAAGGCSGGAGVLRDRAVLAGGQPGAAEGAAGAPFGAVTTRPEAAARVSRSVPR